MSEEPNFSNLNLSCCVTLCKNFQNIRSNIELYPLPDDSSLRKLYSDTLGIPLEVALDKHARVCALHFVSKNPEIRKHIGTASQLILKPAVPAMANSNYSSTTPIVLGNQPTYVNLPFNSNFGPPIRFFLQKPVSNTSSVSNQGIKFLSPSNNYSAKGTSILKRPILSGSTTGAKDISNNPQEIITIPPDESSNNSVESIEGGVESELDLQCDEEQLSQAQLNAYYTDLMNFISANEKIARIPVPAKTETISVQTDPVTILASDPIPLEEPCITITDSSDLQSLEEEEEISLINQFSGLSGAASASHKITQIIDKNTSLLNSVQVPPRQNDGLGTSSTMSASDRNKSSISTLTIPSSTLSNAYTYGDRSTLPANDQTVRYEIRPPPAYIPREKTTEAAPLINQVYSQTSLRDANLMMGQHPSSAAMLVKTYQKKQSPWPERQKATLQVYSITSNQSTGALPTYNLTTSNQPLQYVIQNKDQPIVLRSNTISASGATVSGFNSAASASATNNIDNDKEADDLLNLCNVTTVYGNDSPSQASTDSDVTFDINPVSGVLEKLKKVTNSSSGNSSVTGAQNEVQPPSGTFPDSSGPLIVDVISATEGAKEYFIGDKMPTILFNKNSQKSSNGKEMYTANLPLNNSYQAGVTNANVPLREKDMAGSSSADKSKSSDGLPPTIKLNNSVFSFQKSIPILPTGSVWVGKPHLFLNYLNLPVLRSRSAEAEVLRGRLQTEKYIPCSAWWMVRRNYLPTISPCQCKCHAFTIHRSPLFPNGFYWQCENPHCLRKESVRKPKFFEEYKNWTIEELLLMTFHWACQTPFAEVLEEVKLSPDCILTYYTALRNLCRQVSMKKCKLGTSPYDYVEASLVKLGSYFVLGAYDRNTNYIRLEVLEESQAYNSTLHIELLKTWLTDKAVLVTEQRLSEDTLKGICKKQANPDVYNITSKEPHILTISNFLLTNLTAIFGKVNVDSMSLDQVKGLLYELQWRAKYGKFLDMAFWSIMNDIRDLNDYKKGQITVKPGNLDVEGYCEKMPPILRNHWGFIGPAKEKTDVARKYIFKKKFSPSKKAVPQKTNPLQPPTTLGIKYPAIQPKKTQPEPPKKTFSLSNINESCSKLFKDVPFIPGGNSNITSKSLLAIKIRCEDSSPSGVYKPNATSLGLQLRTEGFISNPVKWLVKRGYLSGHNPCYVCKQTAVLKSNDKFKDGCSWSCQNEKCKFENMFKRPLFFARFNEQPMAQIAAMIFHWTVQSDYNIVVSDVPLEPVKISHAWRAFQVLCSSALKRENFKVGGEGQVVEVALVQFGKLYILGARHRITKRTLLKCFPTERIDQVYLVHQTLRNWIIPGSHVAVNASPLFSLDKSLVKFNADTSITDKSSTQMHVLNITSYLMKHVFDMFGHLRASTVKSHLMQVYLDELMWRERFGKLPNLAFAKIMYEIFYHEKHSNTFLQNHHFNFSVKELIEEEPQIHAFRKEVCVVLHRIPQTVLKYYNCWPIPKVQKNEVASTPIEISNSDDDSISRILSEEDFQFSDSTHSVSSNEKRNFTKHSKGKTVHRRALDESSSSSSSSSEEEGSCFSGDGGNTSPESVSDESSDVDNLLPYTGKRRKAAMQDRTAKVIKKDPESPDPKPMNSVQKLVIKMNKNSQKCQSYFKSDTVKAKYKRQRSRGLFNVRRSRKKSQNKSRSKINPSQNKLKPDVVVKQEILDDEPGPSGYCPPAESEAVVTLSPRRRTLFTGKQICIECGKEIKFEHFMKRYDCTDCTKTKYSTCCRNAFFEHRSALLFGKRPPRRDKVKLNYGLHRPRPLSYTVACPCGFKTKVGNEMASHLVRCHHSICVSQS